MFINKKLIIVLLFFLLVSYGKNKYNSDSYDKDIFKNKKEYLKDLYDANLNLWMFAPNIVLTNSIEPLQFTRVKNIEDKAFVVNKISDNVSDNRYECNGMIIYDESIYGYDYSWIKRIDYYIEKTNKPIFKTNIKNYEAKLEIELEELLPKLNDEFLLFNEYKIRRIINEETFSKSKTDIGFNENVEIIDNNYVAVEYGDTFLKEVVEHGDVLSVFKDIQDLVYYNSTFVRPYYICVKEGVINIQIFVNLYPYNDGTLIEVELWLRQNTMNEDLPLKHNNYRIYSNYYSEFDLNELIER